MNKNWALNGTRICVNGALDGKHLSEDGWSQLSKSQQQTLIQQGKAEIYFEAIPHVDSAGLAWVLNWLRDSKKNKIDLTLVAVPDKLVKLAQLSNVADILPITDGNS